MSIVLRIQAASIDAARADRWELVEQDYGPVAVDREGPHKQNIGTTIPKEQVLTTGTYAACVAYGEQYRARVSANRAYGLELDHFPWPFIVGATPAEREALIPALRAYRPA